MSETPQDLPDETVDEPEATEETDLPGAEPIVVEPETEDWQPDRIPDDGELADDPDPAEKDSDESH